MNLGEEKTICELWIIIKWSGISPSFARLWYWPRRHLLECTSEWIDRKCSQAVYSGFCFRPISNSVAFFSTNEIAFRCECSVFSGVFGVSIFSYVKLITAGRDKKAVIASLVISFCEGNSWSFNKTIIDFWFRSTHDHEDLVRYWSSWSWVDLIKSL